MISLKADIKKMTLLWLISESIVAAQDDICFNRDATLEFIDKLKELSVNDPYSGKTVTGGIITITDSNWLMSFTCNRQPHFPEQPDDILVIWVYSLFMDKEGNYVKKAMPECTGNEILEELCCH